MSVPVVDEVLERMQRVPHVPGCRSEFAPQLCNCERGEIIDLLEAWQIEADDEL